MKNLKTGYYITQNQMGYTKSRRVVKRQQPKRTRKQQYGGNNYEKIMAFLQGPHADIMQGVIANKLEKSYKGDQKTLTKALEKNVSVQTQIIAAYKAQLLLEEKGSSPKQKSASSPKEEENLDHQQEFKHLRQNYKTLELEYEGIQSRTDAEIASITKALAASEAKVKACESEAAKQDELWAAKLASVQAKIQVEQANMRKELVSKQRTVDELILTIKQLEGDLAAAEQANKLLSNSISPEQYEVAMRNIESKVREQFEANIKQHKEDVEEKQTELKKLRTSIEKELKEKAKVDAELLIANREKKKNFAEMIKTKANLMSSRTVLHKTQMIKAGLNNQISKMEKYAQHLNDSTGVIQGLKSLAGLNKVNCTLFPTKDTCNAQPLCHFKKKFDNYDNDISFCTTKK